MRTQDVTELIKHVAGEEILPRWRALGPDDVQLKRPGDPVTVADRAAEAALTAAFLADDPGCLVVGEEASFADPSLVERLPDADRAWVVDPVDGTRNFADGSPDFGVMVAEVRAGITVRAWIWQPVHGHLWVAEKGAGVELDGVGLGPVPATSDALVGASYLRLVAPDEGIRLVRTASAAAVDYPRLLDGGRDFLAYRTVHPWDHLPGVLMLTEQGGDGRLTTGQSYRAGAVGAPLLLTARAGDWSRVREALFDADGAPKHGA